MQQGLGRSGLIALLLIMVCSSGEKMEAKNKGLVAKGGDVLFFEDFEQHFDGSLLEGWWVEGGERVWVEDGRLRVKANPRGKTMSGNVCTVWCKQLFSGNLRVEFDAHVLDSTIEANNINFFFLFSDPKGTPLYETRESRTTGAYKMYHNLNGYIFTFLNDFRNEREGDQARMRMRRCPGFKLITESYDYYCRKNVTYHVTITKLDGHLSFAVDHTVYLKAHDKQTWPKGLIGLRTFQTDLWWDNIMVTLIE